MDVDVQLDVLNRAALGIFLFAFWSLAVVRPTLRQRRRTGASGFVAFRAGKGAQRWAVGGMGVFLFSFMGWCGAFIALGSGPLGLWPQPAWTAVSGWVLCLGGLALVLAAQAQMGRSWRIGIDPARTELVTHGLFALSRNPIFGGIGLAVAGVALLTPSPVSAGGAVACALLLSWQARLEERHLLASHGAGYRRYATRVGRFMPGLGRLSP